MVIENPCLIFQSDDSSKPCFVAPRVIPAQVQATTSSVLARCADGTVFEQNECISQIAQKTDDPSLCVSVKGSLAQSSCREALREPLANTAASQPKSTYVSFLKSYVASSSPSAFTDLFAEPVRSPGITNKKNADDGTPAQTSLQAVWSRFANQAAMATYTVFPYQSRPGDTVKVQGSGFALDATNVVHIGGIEVSGLASPDGISLSVVIPSSASFGSNEVWVTNKRGSSRSAERPVYAIISLNPAPAPVITGVLPENPTSSDIITLVGSHLEGLAGVYTTFGQSKAGTSLSFKIEDLERSWLVLNDESVKGKKVPLYVYVQTEGGLSKDPFIFDVQY